MKFCSKCGNQMSDNAAFCPSCGERKTGSFGTEISTVRVPKNRGQNFYLVFQILFIVFAGIALLANLSPYFSGFYFSEDAGFIEKAVGIIGAILQNAFYAFVILYFAIQTRELKTGSKGWKICFLLVTILYSLLSCYYVIDGIATELPLFTILARTKEAEIATMLYCTLRLSEKRIPKMWCMPFFVLAGLSLVRFLSDAIHDCTEVYNNVKEYLTSLTNTDFVNALFPLILFYFGIKIIKSDAPSKNWKHTFWIASVVYYVFFLTHLSAVTSRFIFGYINSNDHVMSEMLLKGPLLYDSIWNLSEGLIGVVIFLFAGITFYKKNMTFRSWSWLFLFLGTVMTAICLLNLGRLMISEGSVSEVSDMTLSIWRLGQSIIWFVTPFYLGVYLKKQADEEHASVVQSKV